MPGLPLADQLRRVVESSEVCVFLATRRSIQSQWCLAELGAFWGAGKRTIVYLADPDLTEADIPPQFHGILRTTNVQQLVRAAEDALKAAKATRKAEKGTRKATPRVVFPDDLLPVEFLRSLAEDSAHQMDHVRLACSHTLWSSRPDRAVPVLEDQLGDWRDVVRRHALFLLDTYSTRPAP